ncbi:MAG: hypothetical protein PVJ58_08625 [Chromatiales bacterium]|jgi:hypothetical protein
MNIARKRSGALSAIAALSLGLSAGSVSAAESEWEWSIALYGWMSGIDAEVFANDRKVGEIDMSFSDILDDLDMTLMLHGEGFRGQWGVFADLVYLDISGKETGNLATTKYGMSSTIFDLAGVYRLSGTPLGFEAYAGLRYFSMDLDLEIVNTPISARIDNSYADFLVGARYTGEINRNWFYRLRGDVSAGETDGTWSVMGLAGYRFGKQLNMSAIFGYRHLEIDLEDDQGPVTISQDLTMSGPFVAFNYAF